MWEVNAGPWECVDCGKPVSRYRPSNRCGECDRNLRRFELGMPPTSTAELARQSALDDSRAVGQ